VIFGDSALRKLALMKLRGGFRRQLKRLRTPSGFIFAIVGAGLSIFWLVMILVGRSTLRGDIPEGEELRAWTELGIFVFVLLTGVSAVTVRGLYLPRQEIERFFSAPITRGDLVRYRMLVDLVRTLFGAVILALLTFQRMPVPLFGFLGVMAAMFTLGIFRQTISLVLGGARSRLRGIVGRRRLVVARIALGLLVWVLVMAMFTGDRLFEHFLGNIDLLERSEDLITHPVARALFTPFRPWAAMMAATTLPEFLRWAGLCLFIWLALFELTARLPIDFREQSLETSEEITRRLRRVGRGGALGGGDISHRAAARRVPWFFGRGPGGAVAWIKTASIVRKARGTLLVSLVIMFAVTIGVSVLLNTADRESGGMIAAVGGPVLIAVLGVVYMSGSLRFDYRADLDQMEQIKAWPVHPRRAFVATLLPQVMLISGGLAVAILLRAAFLGLFHPLILVVLVALPLVEFAWLSVDNSVYLFAPVRFVPGQEGTLHHSGRALLLFLLRMVLMAVTLGLIAAPAAILYALGPESLGIGADAILTISIAIGFVVLVLLDALLAWVGGRMLKRFDVARDRG
jgi:hypothetical protein